MDAGPLAVIALALVVALTALIRLATGIPRLRIEPSLRGTTRAGTLYVIVHNRGRWRCRDLIVSVEWSAADGNAFPIDERRIPELAGKTAISITIKDLHRGLPAGVRWDDIIIKARAGGAALADRASLRLAARSRGASSVAEAPPAAVEYRRIDRCEASSDGQHFFQDHDFLNDGVLEHWHVCRRCHVARRDPLSREQEAAQQRVRAERVARERRDIEAEFARREEQEAHAAAGHARSSWRERPAADPDADRLPVQVALWILGIEDARPTLAVVEAAHRRLAKEYHPDRAPAGDAKAHALFEEKMRDINRARDRLREHLRE